MHADHYYGENASKYDAQRSDKPMWAREAELIERLVTHGPLLDIPVGTGRFLGIYRAKHLSAIGMDISKDMIAEAYKKHPAACLMNESVYSIPFADKSFKTVVCIRLLHWLYPDDMQRAVKEICRVGSRVIVSLRWGREGKTKNTYTHDKGKFLAATCMLVEDVHYLEDGFDLFVLRDPNWHDVKKQFAADFEDTEAAINRLAAVWTRRHGLEPVNVFDGKLTVGYWSSEYCKLFIHELESVNDSKEFHMTTSLKPRDLTNPPVVLKVKGKYGLLDGRRRLNHYTKIPGTYPVIIVEHK